MPVAEHRRVRLALGLALLLAPCAAVAGGLESAHIDFEDGSYSFVFVALFDAAPARVRAIVHDHARYQRLNDSINEASVLARDDDGALTRRLRVGLCVLKFCFNLTFVERVHGAGDHLTTTIVPGAGSFRDGVAQWRLEAVDDAHTRLTVRATQTPDFWIPPMIGPAVLKRVFLAEVDETCAAIERLARAP